MFFGTALLWALMFSVPAALLSLVRRNPDNKTSAAVSTFFANFVALTIFNWANFYFTLPATSFSQIIKVIFWNILVIAVIVTVVCSYDDFDPSAALLAWPALFIVGIIWIFGHNSDHNPVKATHIVAISEEAKTALPASSTSNIVTVSADIATTKAKQAMASGIAGQRSYNTYLNLGPATLQYVDGKMLYVFPLHFDGSGNKHRLNSIEPGYIMVSGEDPNAEPVEHYDGQYTMKVCQECGQASEPDRWAYAHGIHAVIEDPTLEVDDQGKPYWTATINTPHLGWTYYAPSKLLLIDAHTGKISVTALKDAPDWVDRVYSQNMASDLAGWYGDYGKDGKNGWNGAGSSNANRFQVSRNPVLVYTGDGHPDWRILLTSHNSDTAVSKIVIMDAHNGSMRVYTPQQPMGIEEPVEQAFDNATGQGAGLVKANRYHAVGLTLHVIYGHLTWVATYEPQGTHPSYVGLGFVDAYNATASNVAFGNSKATALSNYLTQLASEGNANGNIPEQGGQDRVSVTGTVKYVSWDISGGQKYWYITLVTDPSHVYVGTVSSIGPALVLVQPGDKVTVSYFNTGALESARTMQSFTDARVLLKTAGS